MSTELPHLEIPMGDNVIYGIPLEGDRYRMICDCRVYPGRVVEIFVTHEQARQLALPRHERPALQTILPAAPRELREIFITGYTPAEWDHLHGNRVKKPEEYPGYTPAET